MAVRAYGRVLAAGSAMVLLLSLGACGGGGVASTPTPAPTPTPTPTPPPPPPPAVDYNTAEYARSNGAVSAHALAAYQAGATGAGIVAGVIDSGINPASPEFTGRILAASGDTAGNRGLGDDDGHGTAVAATLAAARNDSGIQGVAFNASLLIARTDTPGSCTNGSGEVEEQGCQHPDAAIARGVDLAVANRARVINISLGGSPANAQLSAAIGNATAAGVVIVISAGNEGAESEGANPDPLAAIALDPVARGLVVIAGAVDENGSIASFSNRAGNAASQYLTALGVRVRTIDNQGQTAFYTGTSFAAPVVSGAVALLAQAFPNLSGAQIVQLLFSSARDAGAAGDDAVYGQGVLDIARAFQPQGALALAGSGILIADTGNATLSAAMGDGGQGSLDAVVLDDYERAYALDLKRTIRSTAPVFALGAALRPQGRHLGASSASTSVSLSIADEGHAMATPLLLDSAEVRRSRATAGMISTRLDRQTRLAFGVTTTAGSIAAALRGESALPFLVAEDPRGAMGFARQADTAFALRRTIAGFGLTVTAEQGEALLYEGMGLNALRGGTRRYGYDRLSFGADRRIGPVALALEAGRLAESDTVLGAHFGPALGSNGATSWFFDASARWEPGGDWSAGGVLRRGITDAAAGGALRRGGRMHSSAFAIDIARAGLLRRDDRFALRLAQPLRVARGGLDLLLPAAYDYETRTTSYAFQRLDLAPAGRERDAEAAYARPLGAGWLTANAYYRREPGNLSEAPDDLGAALRFTMGF